MKPKVGQTWAIFGPEGRRVKIASIKRGICGQWGFKGKKLVPISPKYMCVWVSFEKMCSPMSVKSMLRDMVYVE